MPLNENFKLKLINIYDFLYCGFLIFASQIKKKKERERERETSFPQTTYDLPQLSNLNLKQFSCLSGLSL